MRALLGAILLAAAVAAHLPEVGNGIVWDDDVYLTENPLVRSPGGLAKIWFEPLASPQYYPLVFSMFWSEHRIWGLHPAGYHWVNILLHAGTTFLLWLALARLSVPGAWLAALWFGIHPVHVESVAWITERKNVLSGILYLGSFLACLRAFRLDGHRADAVVAGEYERRSYALALLLFAGALLSKTVVATLPIAVAIAFWFRRGRLPPAAFWGRLAPFLLLGALAGATTVWLEVNHVGARGADWSLSPLGRALVAGRAVWFYAWKICWPADLVFIYPRWAIDAGNPQHYLPLLGVVALLTLLWRLRARLGRGPLAAMLYFGVTLGPALGFVNVYPMRFSFVADHFQYLASIGMLALLAAAATRFADRAVKRFGRPVAVAAAGVAAAASLLLAGLSWRQTAWYRDEMALWKHTTDRNPGAVLAQWNLGDLLASKKRPEEALRHYRVLRRLTPEDPAVLIAMGSALLDLQRPREAARHFEEAIRMDPRETIAMNRLGFVFSALGQRELAESWYRRAAAEKATPAEHAYACEGVGVLAARAGDHAEALRWFEQGLDVCPQCASLHYNLGLILDVMGDAPRAEAEYLTALRIRPDDPMAVVILGDHYEGAGEAAKATATFEEMERRHPGKAEAAFARGRILEIAGRRDESQEWFLRALAAPTDVPQIREMADRRIRR